MSKPTINILTTFYIAPIFIISAIRTLWELKISENPSYFFFSKFWFYSLLVYIETLIAKRMNKVLVVPAVVSFLAFTVFTYFDEVFWFKAFDRGLPIYNFANSMTSFFISGAGIPKISLVSSFVIKAGVLLWLAVVRKIPIFYAFLYFTIAYVLWNLFHLEIIYGRIKVFDMILSEKVGISYIISGIIYFAFFLIPYLKQEKSDMMKGFASYATVYLIILASLGFFSSGQQGYVKTIKVCVDILPFYLVAMVFRKMKEIKSITSKDVKDILVFSAMIISILAQSRGIFTVILVFILPVFAVYYLPPLELQNSIFGAMIHSIFSGLLFIVSHLSSKTTFSVTQEATLIALTIISFSFLSYISGNSGNLIIRRISGTVACLTPLALFHSAADIIICAVAGIFCVIFPKSEMPKLALALYFTSKYIYIKEKLSKTIL